MLNISTVASSNGTIKTCAHILLEIAIKIK